MWTWSSSLLLCVYVCRQQTLSICENFVSITCEKFVSAYQPFNTLYNAGRSNLVQSKFASNIKILCDGQVPGEMGKRTNQLARTPAEAAAQAYARIAGRSSRG